MKPDLTFLAAAAAVASFVSCAVLGRTVGGRALPLALDINATALRGHNLALAAFFTALGRWWAIGLITAVAAIGAVELRSDPRPLGFLFASQLVAQAVVTTLKRSYRRMRPFGSLRRPEADLSYPSGHAATAVVFYGGLFPCALHLGTHSHFASFASVAALGACCIGLPWSRLALGAHYATDVIGGLLFGAGWSCALFFLETRFAFGFRG